MESKPSNFMLENGLNLSEVVTTGSILQINQEFDEADLETNKNNDDQAPVDIIGRPVTNFTELAENLTYLNETGFVKKRIIEKGGGEHLHDGHTVFVAYSGYWEKELQPFDMVPLAKPMEINLEDNGLLPGLVMAIKSMLVGETSIFLLSYQVMYGRLGVPPRIKPKSDCVFYITLIKSIITPEEGSINFAEPNMFTRVQREVKLLYSSGYTLYNTKNYKAAIQIFKKAVNMLHKCRLADEKEEEMQEKLLKKLYTNLAVCYNKVNKPLLACSACNEMNRLRNLWNNGKVLFQNAKALRIIGAYEESARRLKKAMSFYPDNDEMKVEYEILVGQWLLSKNSKIEGIKLQEADAGLASYQFKRELDDMINNFKANDDENELMIPTYFNTDEIAYFREVCVRENLFFQKFGNCELNENQEINPLRAEESDDYVLIKKWCPE